MFVVLKVKAHPRLKFAEQNLHNNFDPLQWMGAVNARVQIADKSIIIIHNSSPSVKLKHINYRFFFLQIHSFLLHKTLSDGLESSGFLVDYCDVFLSAVWTFILTTNYVMLIFSKSLQMKQTLSLLEWPEDE